MLRRRFVSHLGRISGLAIGAGLLTPGRVFAAVRSERIRIGLTPVFLDDQVGFLNDWRSYLESRLGRPVEFVQRGSYREIVDLIRQDKIQFAWLCGFPYVRNKTRLRLLAVPVHGGQPLYQSYLIVPESDSSTQSILDLRDKVFAYSDPDSNSGFLFPQYQLTQAKVRTTNFFRRSFFTYSHRNVIEAVAARVAHGGAVDGYVWNTLRLTHPELTMRTRIVARSPYFGFPPLVAGSGVPADDFTTMRAVLLSMHESTDGKLLLRQLNLDRFDSGSIQLFDGIERMVRAVRLFDAG